MPKAHTLVDDFSDPSKTTSLWNIGYPPVQDGFRHVNGRLEITLPSGITGGGQLTAKSNYDLTNSEVRLEVIKAPRRSSGVFTMLSIYQAGLYGVYFKIEEGNLNGVELLPPDTYHGDGVAYDETQHRWLRIRELKQTVYCEASPDGVTWTAIKIFQAPGTLDDVQIVFSSSTWAPAPSSPAP